VRSLSPTRSFQQCKITRLGGGRIEVSGFSLQLRPHTKWHLFATSGRFLLIANLYAFLVVASVPSFAGDNPGSSELAKESLSSADAADSGRKIFGQNCTYCHGSKGLGGKAQKLQCRTDLTTASLFDTITNGRQSGAFIMPPWGDVFGEKERWELVAYILTLRDLPTCNGG
jgi:mono/diheme cytochrome c family protein